MSKSDTKRQMLTAVAACEAKKAEEISILEMAKSSSAFTDYMLICHGTNPRQVQAIADEVELRLKQESRAYPNQIEGYNQAEWVLMDYVDFVLHIFSAQARKFYDLERLWRNAQHISTDDLRKPLAQDEEEREVTTIAARSRRPSRPKTASPVRAALAKPKSMTGRAKKKGAAIKSAVKKPRSRKES